MSRRPTRLEQIFNIEVPSSNNDPSSLMSSLTTTAAGINGNSDSRSSTPPLQQQQLGSDDHLADVSGSRNPLTSTIGGVNSSYDDEVAAADNFTDNVHFIRSYSVDGGLEASSTAGPSRSRGVSTFTFYKCVAILTKLFQFDFRQLECSPMVTDFISWC